MTENQQPKQSSTNKTTVFIDEDKNTQLHYLAAQGNIEEIKKEIEEKGHEVDPINYLGWTPLMMATRYGHMAVMELLIEKRADSTRKNKFGFNILLIAVASGKMDVLHFILQHLLSGGVSRQIMQSFFSPISLAVLFDNVSMVQYLIEKRFCINAECLVGLKPINFANAFRNPDIINILMSNGAGNDQKPQPKESKENLTNNNNNQNTNTNDNNQQQQQLKHVLPPPLVFVHPNSLSPYSPFVQYTPMVQMPRKCSGMMTPCFSSMLSPFPDNFIRQVFFPPEFSPSHFISPPPVSPNMPPPYPPNNEFLNVRFMQVSPNYAPVPVNVPCNGPYKN